MNKHTAYIAIGSNIGDKSANCENGIRLLVESGTCDVLTRSHFYRTEPVEYTDQDWFINAALKVNTLLDPADLLRLLKNIEVETGRVDSGIRFGPRILDMDIILYDDMVLQDNDLVIPHPRMHERRFVLQPMCDIDPTIVHPRLKKDLKSLLDKLDDETQRIKIFK